ncbi:hypothetical protein JCM18899A_51190 [Nocardioides sp. AN3]
MTLIAHPPAGSDPQPEEPSGHAARAWSLRDLDSEDEPPGPPGRRPRRWRRLWITLLVVLLLLVAAPLSAGWYLQHRLTSQIGRIQGVFSSMDQTARPEKPAPGAPGAKAVNILLMGTDRRSDVATTGTNARASDWKAGAQRSDTLMVLHLDGSRQVAAAVSIPRDSWVDIPGHGYGKINWAYSYGGPSLTVATVEKLTGIRIDHLAVVDWDGFKELTDHIGGVDITVPQTVYDPANAVTWTAGRHHLDGTQALLYVRQRYGLPGGDFDRVKRQQAFLRAVMQASMNEQLASHPKKLYGLLETVARNVSVDAGWSTTDMAKLVLSMRDFGYGDLRFLTAPVLGTGHIGTQSVVHLDDAAGAELWQDLRTDRIDQWSAVHWDQLTGRTVR